MTALNATSAAESAANMIEGGLDSIQRAEAQLQRMLNESKNEKLVMNVARAMRHLAMARMQLEMPGWHDSRTHARTHESAVVLVERPNHPIMEAALHDISPGGALIECDVPLEDGVDCRMSLPGLDEWVVARSCGSRAGLTRLAFEPESITSLLPLVKHLDRKAERY